MRLLFLPFFLLPIIEMVILIKVGGWIGVWNTLLLVLLTAITGATLLRRQGLATLLRANERMRNGQIPAREMIDGLFLAIGAVLLLTPGFVTDAMGLFCLFPLTRHWLVAQGLKYWVAQAESAVVMTEVRNADFDPRPVRPDREGHYIIEGEYSREAGAERKNGPDQPEKK